MEVDGRQDLKMHPRVSFSAVFPAFIIIYIVCMYNIYIYTLP